MQQLSRVAHYNEFLSQCRNSDIQTLWQLRTLAVVPQAATECYKLTTHLCGMLVVADADPVLIHPVLSSKSDMTARFPSMHIRDPDW